MKFKQISISYLTFVLFNLEAESVYPSYPVASKTAAVGTTTTAGSKTDCGLYQPKVIWGMSTAF